MKRPIAITDTECDFLYWLIEFKLPDGRVFPFEICAEDPKPLNYAAIQWFIDNYTLGTFNGKHYDESMIEYAMAGANVHALKKLNDLIIVGGLKRHQFIEMFPGVPRLRNLDHIDIMEVAPGVKLGLKTYMGRMHAPLLQDLSFDPHNPMPIADRQIVRNIYCPNDLLGTKMLFDECADRLALREEIGAEYGIDVRSKSDAQIAEAIFKKKFSFWDEYAGKTITPKPRYVPHGHQFRYTPPAYLQFQTPVMQAAFRTVTDAVFVVNDVDQIRRLLKQVGYVDKSEDIIGPDGKKIKTGLIMPAEIKALKIPMGSSVYQMGIGGLHSTESGVSHYTIMGRHTISDHDVASYYPSLILNSGMYPETLGPEWLTTYRHEYDSRIAAKRAKQKTKANGKKIVLNGTFGKLFSKYSIMYNPEQGLWVTITGQLSLLMLIEALELGGISCVSANTDGIVLCTPVGREWMRDYIIKDWEKRTGLEMEATFYKSIHQRDVNSYVAIKIDGEVKGKGSFAKSGVENNVHPEKDICKDAVIAYLKAGTPIEQTVRACRDIRKFLIIRNAKGGGVYRGEYLGKTVRWYYAIGSTDSIRGHLDADPGATSAATPTRDQFRTKAAYEKAFKGWEKAQGLGSKVAGSEGCRPLMTLPESMPDDVDHARYIDAAYEMLAGLGVSVNRAV